MPQASSWWSDWSYPTYDENAALLSWANQLIPYLTGNAQSQVGNYLYANRGGDPWLNEHIGEGYARPSGGPTTTDAWMQSLNGVRSKKMDPAIMGGDYNGGEMDWWNTLMKSLESFGQGSTKGEQRSLYNTYQEQLAQAPNSNWASLASKIYEPYVEQPKFGSAVQWGTSARPFSVKGGLVSNPWYS